MALEDWLEVWPKIDRRLTELHGTRANLPIMNLPTCDSKTSGLLIVSVEVVHMAKSWPSKNQSEGKNLPQDHPCHITTYLYIGWNTLDISLTLNFH